MSELPVRMSELPSNHRGREGSETMLEEKKLYSTGWVTKETTTIDVEDYEKVQTTNKKTQHSFWKVIGLEKWDGGRVANDVGYFQVFEHRQGWQGTLRIFDRASIGMEMDFDVRELAPSIQEIQQVLDNAFQRVLVMNGLQDVTIETVMPVVEGDRS